MVVPKTLANFLERIAQLYEQGAVLNSDFMKIVSYCGQTGFPHLPEFESPATNA